MSEAALSVPRVVLATRNAHKVVEVRRILAEHGVEVDLVGTDAFPDLPDVAETGDSFEANALLKARETARITGLPALADDSGLCVDALHGMPGIFSARWAGRHRADRDNLELVLAQLEDVPDERLGAQFVCAAVVVLPPGADGEPGESRVALGVWSGRLVRAPRGSNGFGYDPIFVPEGRTETSAELPSDVKDSLSHRGRALRVLAPMLDDLLGS